MNKIDMEMYKKIGSILKKHRLEKKMSLDQLVHQINHTKTKSTIKRYEDGVSRIDHATLEMICHVLQIDCNDVLVQVSHSDIIQQFSSQYNIKESLLAKLTTLDSISLIKVEQYIESLTAPHNQTYTDRMKSFLK